LKDEALIAAVEGMVRPVLAPFHCVKLPSTPVEALDLLERDIFQLSANKVKPTATTQPVQAANVEAVLRPAKQISAPSQEQNFHPHCYTHFLSLFSVIYRQKFITYSSVL
jgi:hypothetical protein